MKLQLGSPRKAKIVWVLICILVLALVSYFSLPSPTFASDVETGFGPEDEEDPLSIHLDGSSTTTAPINFDVGLCADWYPGWVGQQGNPQFIASTYFPADVSGVTNKTIMFHGAITAGPNSLAEGGNVYIIGGSPLLDSEDGYGGNVVVIGGTATGAGLRGSNVILQGGNGELGGDIRLVPRIKSGSTENSGIVAITDSLTSIPAGIRGQYGLYVEGRILADDFISGAPNTPLLLSGGTNEPVLIQAPTPVATPAVATDQNDLFVEGKTEIVEGVTLVADAGSGYCAEFKGSNGVSFGYIAANVGADTLYFVPDDAGILEIGDFLAAALNLKGTSVNVTAGTTFNVTADGGLMNVGRQSTPFVLKGKDAFDDEFSPIEAAPLHLYGGLANGVVDGAPVAIGPTGSTGSVLTGDYNLYVHGDTELNETLSLKGLTGPGMLKIDADELVAIATPATDYIATEVDPNAVLADGTRALTADWDAGSYEIRTKTIEVDDDTPGGTLAYFSGIGAKILNSANTFLHISGLGGIDDGTGISLPLADKAYDMWLAYGNNSTSVRAGSTGNELVVLPGPYGEVESGYGYKASDTYPGVSASTCAVWDSDKRLISGTLQPTPTPITQGNLTATSPIVLSATRGVIGGAAAISHATTAGNKHVPTGGSSNQILKNSGASGTGVWGTVTESKGALGAVTNITMTGTTQMNSDTSQLTQGAGRDVFIQYDGTNWLFDIAAATTEISFNDSSYDTNFRIEGNTDANLFFLDAGLDKIGIGVAAPTSKLDVNGDVELVSTGAIYFGDPSTNDSWRIVRSGNNLVFERRESGSWVTKSTMTP